MEFGFWVLCAMGVGVVCVLFGRILLKVASNKKNDSGNTYVKYKMKRKYGEEPTLA